MVFSLVSSFDIFELEGDDVSCDESFECCVSIVFSDVSACSLRRPEALLWNHHRIKILVLILLFLFISDTKTLLGSKTSDEIHFHHGLWTETSTYVVFERKSFFNHFTLSCFNYSCSYRKKILEKKKNRTKNSNMTKLEHRYEDAASDAVRSFTITLLPSSRVLDVGSGWCGPADLLASERDADVVALTVSEAQSFYCRSRGHRTVHANAETLNLADTFGYDFSMCHFCWKVWSIFQTSVICYLVFVMYHQSS